MTVGGDGGGLAAEGEDIEVLEWPLARALQAIRDGEIMDAKTIMLLQHLALNADTPSPAKRQGRGRLAQFAGNGAVHQRTLPAAGR